MNITFNDLRKIKDELPDGAMQTIASKLGLTEERVRNYFGGSHFDSGSVPDKHIEQGPDGGIVQLEDTRILDAARDLLQSKEEEEYQIVIPLP